MWQQQDVRVRMTRTCCASQSCGCQHITNLNPPVVSFAAKLPSAIGLAQTSTKVSPLGAS